MIKVAARDSPAPPMPHENRHEPAQTGHIFRSKLPDIPIPASLPLTKYIFQNLADHSDRPCLITVTGQRLSYLEFYTCCKETASGLFKLGIRRGDIIMLLLHNSPEFVISFIGAAMIGAVSTTCNPFFTPGEVSKQIKACNPKIVITLSQYVVKLKDHCPGNGVAGKLTERSFSGESKTQESELGSAEKHINQSQLSRKPLSSELENQRPDSQLADKPPVLEISWDELPVKPQIQATHIRVITVDDPPEGCLHFSVLSDSGESDPPEITIDPEDPVALPFSSGTTGLPKGVVLTHKTIVSSIAQQVDGENPNLYIHSQDVVLCVLPLFHIYSLNSVLLCSLRVGAEVVLMPKFEIGTMLEVVEKYRVSVAPVVPPLVLALAKNGAVEKFDLRSIRIVLSGAAPLGKDLQEALRTRVPQAVFGQGYGMTEAGPVLSMCLAFAKKPFPSKPGSCGTVVRNSELKVIDTESGASLSYNQPGEICIRGPQVMKGYLNDSEATAATIDSEGWLHTGDIGYVDEEEEVFIVDRVKELIKYKGFQVPPAEIEALLLSHPSIADAAVVPQKDEAAGEVPVAFIVRSNGFELTEEVVKDFIAKQVVFYKRLHKVYFIHVIPKSPSGKILRKELKAKLA
ncbi:hypothetical protein AMTRI_Chr03g51610 [Amborella trichopoda]